MVVSRTGLGAVLCCVLFGACGESAPSQPPAAGAGRGGSSSGAGKGGDSGAGTAGAPMGGTGAGGSGTAGRGGGSAGSERGGASGAGTSGEGGENAGGTGGAGGAGSAGLAGQASGGAAGASGEGGGSGTSTLVNMLIMFDRSASMLQCVDGSLPPETSGCETAPSRWDVAATDLTTFLADPAAAELGVALRFFPHDLPAAGCSGGNVAVCDVAACAQPLVELGRLAAAPAPSDTHEVALTNAIAASAPEANSGSTGGTPTYPALAGALSWATAYRAANPDQTTVVVLVTDGEPNGCDEDWDEISSLAVDALSAAGVLTFAVGLTDPNGAGVSVDDMNQLAAAGGTDQAYFVSDGAGAGADLLATLNAIRAGF